MLSGEVKCVIDVVGKIVMFGGIELYVYIGIFVLLDWIGYVDVMI